MMADETKQDVLLKRLQVWIAILTGVAGLIVGVYNIKKNLFSGGKGDIHMTVFSERGQALPDVQIELMTAQNILLNTSETNGEGQYTKRGLEAGSYLVRTSSAGYEPKVTTVLVNAKETTDFKVALKPLPGPAGSSAVRSALEEVGASWIKRLGQPKSETQTTQQK